MAWVSSRQSIQSMPMSGPASSAFFALMKPPVLVGPKRGAAWRAIHTNGATLLRVSTIGAAQQHIGLEKPVAPHAQPEHAPAQLDGALEGAPGTFSITYGLSIESRASRVGSTRSG